VPSGPLVMLVPDWRLHAPVSGKDSTYSSVRIWPATSIPPRRNTLWQGFHTVCKTFETPAARVVSILISPRWWICAPSIQDGGDIDNATGWFPE
jgi:hypothetical protein